MDPIFRGKDLKQEGMQKALEGATPSLSLKTESLQGKCVQSSTLLDACNNSDDDNGEELSESSGCSSHDSFCARKKENIKAGRLSQLLHTVVG
jgi:hypothetical protein